MSLARVRALVVIGVLLIGALVLVTVAVVKDTQTAQSVSVGCPAGFVPANIALPDEKNIKINVYNATDRQGLAEQVAGDFENREVTVVNKPSIRTANDPLGKKVTGVAVLRFGPKAVGAAWVLRAYFLNKAETEFNIDRKDDVVDVVLGGEFRQLATITEVNQSLSAIGEPKLPKGTCDANAR